MSDVLVNFACLDELTQIIYQGICKFVVLSTVSDNEWCIHIGLSGQQGRWWRGSFTEGDITEHFGFNLPDRVLEVCSGKLAENFIQGDICISDWSPERGASIKFTLGPASKKPLHISLIEMSSEEAAAHATQIFTSIALQAQSRKCRLYPSSVDISTEVAHPPRPTIPSKRREPSPEIRMVSKEHRSSDDAGTSSGRKPTVRVQKPVAIVDTKAKAGRSEGSSKARTQNKASTTPAASQSKLIATLARRAKGASLANPNKKARKYQAIEFESDDE